MLFVLSLAFVLVLGAMSLTGTVDIVIGPLIISYSLILAMIAALITLVILVYLFQPSRISTDRY